jgi:hypothetical protein
MRVFRALTLLILVATPVGADEPPLLMRESRAWKGIVEVSARPREFPNIKGGSTQTERIEFIVVTEPPKKTVSVPRLDFSPRETTGRYGIEVDLQEGKGDRARKTTGSGGGGLFPKVKGYVLPTRNHCAFEVTVSPDRLTARTTMVGVHRGKLATFRSVKSARPFLQRFKASGKLEDDGRRAGGSEKFIDRSGRYPRDVTVRWSLERIDPVIEGAITDSAGEPVEGVRILARSTNPYRLKHKLPPFLKEAETDAKGRFHIDVWTASWNLEVLGMERDGVIYSPADLFRVRIDFTETPDLDIRLDAYRLREMPWPHLLHRHFQGDVRGYLEYVRARVPERRMKVALVVKEEDA